jgi:predicted TPR repeat methyltransferase
MKKVIKSILKKIDRIIFPDIYNSHDSLVEILKENILFDCESILDVGCGVTQNSPLLHIAPKMKKVVGIDLFEPSIEKNKKDMVYSEYHLADAMAIGDMFDENSFDCIVATDLLEHLSALEGLKFLEMAKKIAKKKVIIFTPNGYINQEPYDNNIYQIHKSGWSVSKLKAQGFHKIYGINGLKILRGEEARIKFKPESVFFRISLLTNPIVKNHPNLAFQLLGVWDKCVAH